MAGTTVGFYLHTPSPCQVHWGTASRKAPKQVAEGRKQSRGRSGWVGRRGQVGSGWWSEEDGGLDMLCPWTPKTWNRPWVGTNPELCRRQGAGGVCGGEAAAGPSRGPGLVLFREEGSRGSRSSLNGEQFFQVVPSSRTKPGFRSCLFSLREAWISRQKSILAPGLLCCCSGQAG